MRNRWFLNNYLKGNDMWPYVTMWEYEERIIPLRKIVDIFHESCNQKLKCYILTSPLDEERFSVLKAHDNLDFYWVKRLDNQGSLFSCWENRVRLVVGRTLFFVSR